MGNIRTLRILLASFISQLASIGNMVKGYPKALWTVQLNLLEYTSSYHHGIHGIQSNAYVCIQNVCAPFRTFFYRSLSKLCSYIWCLVVQHWLDYLSNKNLTRNLFPLINIWRRSPFFCAGLFVNERIFVKRSFDLSIKFCQKWQKMNLVEMFSSKNDTKKTIHKSVSHVILHWSSLFFCNFFRILYRSCMDTKLIRSIHCERQTKWVLSEITTIIMIHIPRHAFQLSSIVWLNVENTFEVREESDKYVTSFVFKCIHFHSMDRFTLYGRIKTIILKTA